MDAGAPTGVGGDRPAPGGLATTAVVVGTVVLVTVALAAPSFALRPPTIAWPPALAVAAAAAIPVALAATRPWFRPCFGRRHRTVVAGVLVSAFTLVGVTGKGFGAALLLLGILLVTALFVLVAIVGLWSRPADSGSALALIGLVVLGYAALGTADEHTYTRWRMHLAADRYRDAGDRLLADPPADPERLDPDGYVAELGLGVEGVAWPVAEGLPATTTGIVYDPEGAIRPGGGAGEVWACDHLEGPFWWCRLA